MKSEMKAAIPLFIYMSIVGAKICRDELLCMDQYADDMEVTELKYNLTAIKSTFVENRILRTIYFQKNGFQEINGNPSSVELELNEYAYGEGYEFKQQYGPIIPTACLKEMKVPGHIAVGLFVSEYDSRGYLFNDKKSFFYARSRKLSGKFICSGLGFKSGECSITETKWKYEIPYEGILVNKKSNCECGKVSGMLLRNTDFSTMIKVLEKSEKFTFH